MAFARIAAAPRTRGLPALLAAVSLACSADGIMRPPEPSEEIHPTLIGLAFRQTEPQPGWALRLDGRLATGTFMAEDQFVPVTVMTDDGEEVAAELSLRRRCKLPDGVEYACSEILVGIRADHSPDEIVPLLDTLDGAYVNHTRFDSFTNPLVRLFSGEELTAISRLTEHEAVLFAEVNGFFSIDVPPPPPEQLELPVFAFIRTRQPNSGSISERDAGALEVGRDTWVIARYVQPDGSVLEASITIR